MRQIRLLLMEGEDEGKSLSRIARPTTSQLVSARGRGGLDGRFDPSIPWQVWLVPWVTNQVVRATLSPLGLFWN